MEDDPDRAQTQLDEVLEVSRQALAEVRSTVGGSHVPDLDAQLASSRSALEAAGIAVDLPTTASASVPAAGRQLFAWCLREAVTNVIRHADATRCTVTVTQDRLTVADDGVGRTAAEVVAGSATASGSGLRGLRARVAQAGGTLTVEDADPGQERPGTRLEVRL